MKYPLEGTKAISERFELKIELTYQLSQKARCKNSFSEDLKIITNLFHPKILEVLIIFQ